MLTDRAAGMMRKAGLDALISTSPASAAYLTGYTCWIDPLFKEYMGSPGASAYLVPQYTLVTPDRGPALILNPVFAVNASGLRLGEVRTYGKPSIDMDAAPGDMGDDDCRLHQLLRQSSGLENPTDALVALLRDEGLGDAIIGVEMEVLHPEHREALLGALPEAVFKDCTNLIRLMRMVKSPREIALLETAAGISEHAAALSLAMARPGHSVQELVERYRVVTASMGAAFDHLCYGDRGRGIATRTQYVLERGDFLYVDYGCVYEGYYSDAGVTLVLGGLDSGMMEKYRALVDCEARAIELIRPGVRSSVIADTMQSVLRDAGISHSFPHGHGVGLEVRDYPIIVPENGLRIRDECVDVSSDLALEEGMVICLEASVFAFGSGSLHCEQSVVVTADACRSLVQQDRSEPVVVSSRADH